MRRRIHKMQRIQKVRQSESLLRRTESLAVECGKNPHSNPGNRTSEASLKFKICKA